MNRELRAALVKEVQGIREKADDLIALLLPDEPDDVCPHATVDDRSTMGETLYRCRACGAESPTPFPSQE